MWANGRKEGLRGKRGANGDKGGLREGSRLGVTKVRVGRGSEDKEGGEGVK